MAAGCVYVANQGNTLLLQIHPSSKAKCHHAKTNCPIVHSMTVTTATASDARSQQFLAVCTDQTCLYKDTAHHNDTDTLTNSQSKVSLGSQRSATASVRSICRQRLSSENLYSILQALPCIAVLLVVRLHTANCLQACTFTTPNYNTVQSSVRHPAQIITYEA
eukprot:15143-Heterococcus_DN1.PRE.2